MKNQAPKARGAPRGRGATDNGDERQVDAAPADAAKRATLAKIQMNGMASPQVVPAHIVGRYQDGSANIEVIVQGRRQLVRCVQEASGRESSSLPSWWREPAAPESPSSEG